MSEVNPAKMPKAHTLSMYDIKQLDKIATAAANGDKLTARESLDEFVKDKKLDKIRNLGISATTLAIAVASRKKIANGVTNIIAKGGDVVAAWFKKANGETRLVSKFFDKAVNVADGVKKAINKVTGSENINVTEYNSSINVEIYTESQV